MFVFGGYEKEFCYMNDLWRFNLKTNKWKLMKEQGNKPSKRCSHTAVVNSI